MQKFSCFLLTAVFFASSYAAEHKRPDNKAIYTLYRSSAVMGGEKWRLHVATFDSADGVNYNRDNCETAKGLFQIQPGVTVTYWCERGVYSKE